MGSGIAKTRNQGKSRLGCGNAEKSEDSPLAASPVFVLHGASWVTNPAHTGKVRCHPSAASAVYLKIGVREVKGSLGAIGGFIIDGRGAFRTSSSTFILPRKETLVS